MENDCNSEAGAKDLGKSTFWEDITNEVSNGNPEAHARALGKAPFWEDNEQSEVGSPEMV